MNSGTTHAYESAHSQALRWRNPIELPDRRVARLLGLAAKIFEASTALVHVPSGDGTNVAGQTFPEVKEGEQARILSFCGLAPTEPRYLIVEDTEADELFRHHEAATAHRFYAGHRLETSEGEYAGTFCLLDAKPRALTAVERDILADLAETVQTELQRLTLDTVDEVTALPNRRGFLFTAGRTLALRDRGGEPVSLVTLELRTANGSHGPAGRDSVRREFARILTDCFRDSDVIARLDEDEFCVLLSPSAQDDVDVPLGRLEQAVERWNRSDNGQHRIGYRHHVLEFDSEEDGDLQGLLAAAAEDRACAEPVPAIGGAGPVSELARLLRRTEDLF